MNAGGQQGQGGQGGSGSGSGSGAGIGGQNGNQATTTTSAQQQQQTTQGFTTSTTANPTQSPTSTSTSSSSSSGTHKTAIIGGVFGGIAGLLLIALLVIFLLNRRAKKRIAEKRGSAEPVTYSNLNNSFAGVTFGRSNHSSQHDTLLPPQPILTPGTGRSTPHGVGMRGGDGPDVERNSGDYFLPTYAESQAGMTIGGARSLGRLNTSHGSGSEATISPMSVRHPGGTPITPTAGISPQSTGGEIPLMVPMMPQQTRDTMGFPVDTVDSELHRASTPGSIVAPIPRHPLVHQDSLERVVREGMMNGTPELQDVSLLGPRNGSTGRVLSQELTRESPILGLNPVRMQAQTSNLSGGVQRFESQRTVSSVSSMSVSVVSDTELERLGVGARGRNLT